MSWLHSAEGGADSVLTPGLSHSPPPFGSELKQIFATGRSQHSAGANCRFPASLSGA